MTASYSLSANNLLSIAFSFKNCAQDVVFASCMPIDVARKQYPFDAYTALSKSFDQVHFDLGYSNLPTHKSVEYAVCGFFKKLLPSEEFHGDLNFETPLLEWNAYSLKNSKVDGITNVEVNDFRLCLSVIREKDAVSITQVGKEKLFEVIGKNQSVCVGFESKEPISVIKKSDPFPRNSRIEI